MHPQYFKIFAYSIFSLLEKISGKGSSFEFLFDYTIEKFAGYS